jgi:hypothetical protein
VSWFKILVTCPPHRYKRMAVAIVTYERTIVAIVTIST